MAGKKRRGGYKVKSRSVKRRAFNARPGRVTGLTRSDYGFPDRLLTKLRYADSISLTASTATQSFRLSSIFDPDYTGVGHQPMFHDQLQLIYGRYRVRGAKITCRVVMRSPPSLVTAEYGPTLFALIGTDSPSLAYATASEIMEQNNGQFKILGDKSGGTNEVVLTNTFSPARDLGLGKDDVDTSAAFGANPAQNYYAHLRKIDQGGNASNTTLYVEIEFFVECFQRLEQVGS